MSRGFTLIELVVVTTIIVLLTALTLPNYRAGSQQLALQRSAYKLAQDLRRAQEMALSSQEFGGEVPAGYGIYLEEGASRYTLFAYIDGDQREVEIINLEKKIKIGDLLPDSPLTIAFIPPDPSVAFYPDAVTASITVASKEAKTIQVNKAGLIAVE